jgi:hypothetical protein
MDVSIGCARTRYVLVYKGRYHDEQLLCIEITRERDNRDGGITYQVPIIKWCFILTV